jgi:uncharacterized membrane protein YccC
MRRPFRIRTKVQEQGLVILALGIVGMVIVATLVKTGWPSAVIAAPSVLAIMFGAVCVFIRLDD